MTDERRVKKSNHKHSYQPCVFEYSGLKFDRAHGFVEGQTECRLGSYCDVCGKIGPPHVSQWYRWVPSHGRSEPTDNAVRELDPVTRTLPTFRLKDMWGQKFVEEKQVPCD